MFGAYGELNEVEKIADLNESNAAWFVDIGTYKQLR